MIEDIFGPLEVEFITDLALALLCGLIVGGERELLKKPAGISTQTLVISGSMMFAFLSRIASPEEPARIAAQIVSGIGFLGAGIILKNESKSIVTNVTTAASIWYSAAIGMALGFNYHVIAISGAIYAVLISRIPHISKKDDD